MFYERYTSVFKTTLLSVNVFILFLTFLASFMMSRIVYTIQKVMKKQRHGIHLGQFGRCMGI